VATRGHLAALRRFSAVSAVVTLVDVGALVAGVRVGRLRPVASDALAVSLATAASWSLHRTVARAGDPFDRWVERPQAFVAAAAFAGGLDVAIVAAVAGGAVVARGSGGIRRVLGAKALALAFAGGVRLVAYRTVLVGQTRRTLARRVPGRAAPGELRLSVVVPAYREEGRIGDSVRRLSASLAEVDLDGGVEVVVVDDGSGDATAVEAAAAGARVVALDPNRGKGAAVRAGVLAARGRTIAFVDADLAYPPEQVLLLLDEVEAGWDVVVGSRRHGDSVDVARVPLLRSVSGRMFNLLTAVVVLGRYRDTQCGCKAFRSDVANLVFSHTRVDSFAFDVEVFHLVERYRLSLTEIPVTLVESAGSTVRVGIDALHMVGDLFRVRRWSGRGLYDLDPADALT
jgi:dolichyl-phosphate beta-glucosyltransferase